MWFLSVLIGEGSSLGIIVDLRVHLCHHVSLLEQRGFPPPLRTAPPAVL